jgi:hypothetical protein
MRVVKREEGKKRNIKRLNYCSPQNATDNKTHYVLADDVVSNEENIY